MSIEAIPGGGPRTWEEFFIWMQNDAYDLVHPNNDADIEDGRKQSIYIYLDQYDNPLYVGITNNLSSRLKAHERQSPWFPQAATYRWYSWVCCRKCLEAMETHAIRLLAPPFNVAKRVTW